MADISSHKQGAKIVTSKTTVVEKITTSKSTSSSSLIRARSSTLHSSNATNPSTTALRSSTLLNHTEHEMSSSMHITKTSTLLNTPDENVHNKQKSSPWFWRRRNASRASLVRSASTNKANEVVVSGETGWMSEKPSADEAYGSKTSTLSSAIAVDVTKEPKPASGFMVISKICQ